MPDNIISKSRILILDGAMGTMIQRHSLSEEDFHRRRNREAQHLEQDTEAALKVLGDSAVELKGDNECLNLTHPETIEEIHDAYIAAGADIIECNTFSANRISQKEYGLGSLAYIMAREGAEIGRRSADKVKDRHVYVAASIGPTSKSLSLAPDINRQDERPYSFREMAEAYGEQLKGVIDGGADIILIETCFDALNTKAALYALEKLTGKAKNGADDTTSRNIMAKLTADGMFPAIVSVSVNDKSGRTLTGQTVRAFYTSVSHYPLLAFGLNCSLGADDLMPLIKEVAEFSAFPVICYPNAGLPNEMGGYDETPEAMAAAVRKMAGAGILNIIGGCCGTTPAHISAIAEAVKGLSPRLVNADRNMAEETGVSQVVEDGPLTVSGLEPVIIDLKNSNFTNIGERTNVAGSRKFAKLIAAGDYETGLQIAAQQIENGAGIIDINMDDAMLDSRTCMEKFVRYISNDPAVAKAALMIDSSHWETILAGLENAQGKCIVNSISLKEGEEVFLKKAAEVHDMGAAMVVMAFDEQGQATTFSRKIEICERAYRLLTEKLHIPPHDIIFDVNVLSVGTGIEEHARYGIDFIEAVRWIKENLPGAYTSGGISNLSFAFRGNNTVREAMHSIFLYHAVKAGLDMGIVNPGMLQVYDDIEPDLLRKAEDVILDRAPDATERLIAKAQEIMAAKENAVTGTAAQSTVQDTVPLSPEERLTECLVKGRDIGLKADVMECYNKYGTAVKVIEGPLMAGMERVGELFGAGKMFLPQVVKSAKIMKEAVSFLEPYMTGDGDESGERPVIINATVKGDVHDIGKNITGIVLGCNGFNVIDLGVMVDKERILDEAVSHKAAIIGASGLITPSLYQMEELCREMTRRGMDTPLFIGGATTSALHTAVKLAPLYAHVFYSPDASSSAVMAKRCMMDRTKFETDEHASQERIRALYEKKVNADVPEAVSGGQADIFPADSYLTADEESFSDIPVRELSIDELMPHFDWRMFLAIWGIKYGGELPEDAAVQKTLDDGKAVLERFRTRHEVTVQICERILPARRSGNDIKAGEATFPMLRQETPDSRGRCLSLADFVPSGTDGPMGFFAISVQTSHGPECTCGCRPKGYRHPQVPGGNIMKTAEGTQDYDSMMDRAVRVTLAEAASIWLDGKLKSEMHPAEGRQMRIVKPAAGYASCPDHTLKKDIMSMLPESGNLGIRFTESYAMIPDASVCGFIFFHPEATYPEIRNISTEQFEDYRRRRGMNEAMAEQFLGHLRQSR